MLGPRILQNNGACLLLLNYHRSSWGGQAGFRWFSASPWWKVWPWPTDVKGMALTYRVWFFTHWSLQLEVCSRCFFIYFSKDMEIALQKPSQHSKELTFSAWVKTVECTLLRTNFLVQTCAYKLLSHHHHRHIIIHISWLSWVSCRHDQLNNRCKQNQLIIATLVNNLLKICLV